MHAELRLMILAYDHTPLVCCVEASERLARLYAGFYVVCPHLHKYHGL
jgi:hypothetical protein